MAKYDVVKVITLNFNCIEALSEADAVQQIKDKTILDCDSLGDESIFITWSSEEG